METSLFNISWIYLKQIGICLNKEEFRRALCIHPSYPAVWALTDTLSMFNVECEVRHLNWDSLIENAEIFFLLHLRIDGGILIYPTEITDTFITYIDANFDKITESKESFEKKWDGVSISVAKINDVFQKENVLKKRVNTVENILLVFLCFSLLVIIVYSCSPSFIWSLFFIVKILGCCFSFLLVRHELGKTSRFEKAVCHYRQITDCKTVLSSPASKLFGILSMSDIGITYFLGGILILFLSLLLNNNFSYVIFLSILSFCSLPYTIFSLCYQYFIVKKWCPFCLGILLTIWLEVIVSVLFIYGKFDLSVNFYDLIISGLIFSVVILLWRFIDSKLKQIRALKDKDFRSIRFKRNEDVFRFIWNKQTKLIESEMFNSDIFIGNINAPIKLTMILSLYCVPCASMYNRISKLLERYSAFFSLQIIFFSYYQEDYKKKMNQNFLYFYKVLSNESFLKLLSDWFLRKDKSLLLKKYLEEYEHDIVDDDLNIHSTWCDKNKISQTPTLYINGYLMPEYYDLEELFYFHDTLKN